MAFFQPDAVANPHKQCASTGVEKSMRPCQQPCFPVVFVRGRGDEVEAHSRTSDVAEWLCTQGPSNICRSLRSFHNKPSEYASTGCIEHHHSFEAILKMSRRIIRPKAEVCQLCDFITARNSLSVPRSRKAITSRASFTTSTRRFTQRSPISNSRPIVASRIPSARDLDPNTRNVGTSVHSGLQTTQSELETKLAAIEIICKNLLSPDKALTEEETLMVLIRCNTLAQYLVSDSSSPSLNGKDGAASALLSMDESSKVKKIPLHKLPPSFQRIADRLARVAYSVVEHPTVFITPKVLELYTTIQSTLGKAETFPEAFNMYANKPLPEEGSSPVKYAQQNPNKAANAIPVALANRALQTAIDAKQLVIAMDIVNATYTKTAFLRAKFIKQGLVPATALVAAPAAAYAIASQFALAQTTMDSAMATNVAFAGILAYVGFTATIGVVAVSTANDQMERVTWAQGMPLRERLTREDERAAIDKIACAWGFKEVWRRGEEEGEDWDNLREWIGRRGMILDRVELMEGME